MKEKTRNLVIVIAVVIGIALFVNSGPLQINFPTTPPATTQPPDYQAPTYNPPDYPDYTPPETHIVPTSLTVDLSPNPVAMDSTLYGDVVSNGKEYPITIHAKHVGSGVEQTYGGLLNDYGKFYDSRAMPVPGYWDFWVTTDTGVTSNKPRVTVQGALITMSRTFWSRLNPFGSDPTTTIEVFCHSSGSCLIFYNDLDAGTSTPLETVYVNSGGYATTSFDISSLANGMYEMDFVVNGIKASDYGNEIPFTLGR